MRRHSSRILVTSIALLTGAAASLVVATPAMAVGGLVVVAATSAETGTEPAKAVDAACPAGTVILGGGADIVGGAHNVQLAGLNPAAIGLPANSMWATAHQGRFGYTGSWYLRAWAICGSGVSGHQIVQASSTATPGATYASATAVCPGAKKVIGAGGRTAGKVHFALDSVDIAANLGSVFVETMGTESVASAPLAVAYAICVNPVPGLQRVAASSAFTSEDKLLSVACPAGTKLHGLGGGITGAGGHAYLDMLGPNGTGTVNEATINAREDAAGYASTWRVDVYGMCAN